MPKLNSLYFVLCFLSLSLLAGFSFAQNDDFDDSEEIEQLNKNMEAMRSESLKASEMLQQKSSPMGMFNRLSGNEEEGSPSIVSLLKTSLKPVQEKSVPEIETLLLQTSSKKPSIKKLFEKHPKLLNFVARLLKDPEALPGLANISNDRKKILYFFCANIFLFFFGKLLKRFIENSDRPEFMYHLRMFFIRLCIVFSMRIGTVIYFFGKDLKPIAEVVKQSFV